MTITKAEKPILCSFFSDLKATFELFRPTERNICLNLNLPFYYFQRIQLTRRAFFRKHFFEPTVIVKADTFSDRQERAKAALAKSPSQLRVLQRVRSSQQVEEVENSLTEYNMSQIDSVDQGGIEIVMKTGVDKNLLK